MRRLSLAITVGVAVAGVIALPAAASPPGAHGSARTCPATSAGHAACLARVVIDSTGKPLVTSGPSGYGTADIRGAYGLASASGAGRTVAIVDAYDDPTAESDLAVYRSQYGLTPCTTANGCFRKVNQTGGSTPPRVNAGWATEISLDVDMVSATCPDCKILLVEANSTSFTDLGAGVNYAATQGVSAISNSYGGSDSAANAAYDHPGIAVTASTGDSGYGVESPASFGTVVAVGGTHLTKSGSGWSESAWSGAGSGCSTKNAKPSWQTSATQCSGKANADVSAVADPNTGVAVYDTTKYQGRSGWQVYGGTSVASPIIASVYAMGGNLAGYPASYTWTHATSATVHDVTSGSNGSCTTAVWCNAGTGWDGPTGLGTPAGLGAF